MECGRGFQPRRCMPAAMAPDVTRMTWRPSARNAAICPARAAINSIDNPAPSLVTRALPTLMTRRRLFCICVLIRIGCGCTGQRFQVLHDGISQRLAALAADGRDDEVFVYCTIPLDQCLDSLCAFFLGYEVNLVDDQPARFVEEGFIVFAQFPDDGVSLAYGIDVFVEGRHVDQMQQQAGALQMLEKTMAQAGAFGRALDQARNVGDDEAEVVVHTHDA